MSISISIGIPTIFFACKGTTQTEIVPRNSITLIYQDFNNNKSVVILQIMRL